MDDEFDLHANLDAETAVLDTATSNTSFYKSSTFKVLIAVLVIIVIVFVVSYFWSSKTPTLTPLPLSIPKTEHEKLTKHISKEKLYEVMRASDNTQQERRKELLNEFRYIGTIKETDIDTMTSDRMALTLMAKGIYERLANEMVYMPSRNDIYVLRQSMKTLTPTKTVTINPIPVTCDEPIKTDDTEDDNSIIEIGKKSPLDDLDQ